MEKRIFNVTSVIMMVLVCSLTAACSSGNGNPTTYPDPDNAGVTICEGWIPAPDVITVYKDGEAKFLSGNAKTSVWNGVNSLINPITSAEEIEFDIYEENLDDFKSRNMTFEFSYSGDYSIKDYGTRFDAIVFIFDGDSLIYGYRTKSANGEYDDKIPAYYVVRGDEFTEKIEDLKTLVFG